MKIWAEVISAWEGFERLKTSDFEMGWVTSLPQMINTIVSTMLLCWQEWDSCFPTTGKKFESTIGGVYNEILRQLFVHRGGLAWKHFAQVEVWVPDWMETARRRQAQRIQPFAWYRVDIHMSCQGMAFKNKQGQRGKKSNFYSRMLLNYAIIK